MQAAHEVETSGMAWLLPAVRLASGELARERGHIAMAKAEFEQASTAWVDDLPETASIEARSHLGLMEVVAGQSERGRQAIEASVRQARRTGAYWIEVECLIDLARALMLEHRPAEALAALRDVPPDGERAVGRELQAGVQFWRARGLSSEGKDGAAEYSAARKLVQDMSNSLPDEARPACLARPDIELIRHSPVQ